MPAVASWINKQSRKHFPTLQQQQQQRETKNKTLHAIIQLRFGQSPVCPHPRETKNQKQKKKDRKRRGNKPAKCNCNSGCCRWRCCCWHVVHNKLLATMKTHGTSTTSNPAALATTCPVMLGTNEVN